MAPPRAACQIAKDPKLLTLAAIPFLLNVALYLLLFRWGSGKIHYFSDDLAFWMAARAPAWIANATALLAKLTAWAILILISVFSFTLVGSVFSAPFNDAMSKRAYLLANKTALPGIRLDEVVKLELRRAVILLSGGLFTLLLGLVPLMQIPALAAGSFLLAFEYFGYPIAQQDPRLRSVWIFTIRHPFVSLGFGCCLLLIMALPLLSLFYLPVAVVAGSSLFAELQTTRFLARR